MRKGLLSILAMAVLMVVSTLGHAQTTYTKVNSASGLEAGAQYILVGYDNDGQAFVMSYQKTNNRHAVTIDEVGGVITATVATSSASQTEPYEFTLGGSAGEWTLYDPLNDGYLCAPGGGNYLKTQATLDDKGKWAITDGEDGGMVPVSNGGVEQCYMRYNITSTLFGCYKESSNVVATVYFFKAGDAVINPEPTNYPTDAWASVNGTDVTIHWTDAIGDQLPDRYLVVGSTGTPTVPTDGVPVPDGELVANVNYGVQHVTFGLDGNTAYHFAIFPYTNGGSNIDYKTDGDYPKVNATTEQVYTLLFEGFDQDLGSFTAFSVAGEQEWHQAAYNNVSYANMNGYADGAAHANEDWLISPEIPIERVYDAYVLQFRTAMKFDGEPLLVKVSSDYNGGDPTANGNWVDITDNFSFSEGNYTWVESGRYDLSDDLANQAASFYVAFVYASTDEAASSWEIDYVMVTGESGVSVPETEMPAFSVYPNPAHDVVSFNLTGDAQVSIYDMTGRMVRTMDMVAGQGQCQVANLENGVYFLNIRYTDGKTEVARFVKF